MDIAEEARGKLELRDRGLDQQLLQASEEGLERQTMLLRLAQRATGTESDTM